jgi:muconate cycloisomerase
MKIVNLQVREVSVPRAYETYCADPDQLQSDTDHARSRYQIIEVFTEDGPVGIGEVSDIARRMQPPTAAAMQDLLADVLLGADALHWRTLYTRVAAALPASLHPELKGLILFGVEIALLDLVGKYYNAPLYEFLGGRCRKSVAVCWVAFLRGDVELAEELEAFGAEIREKTASGLRAFKLKVGEDHERDLARIELFRRLAGPDLHLRVDASGAWEEEEAIKKIKDMAAAGVNACETPIVAVNRAIANDHPERINANADAVAMSLARVRAASPIDIIEHVADLGDVFITALARHQAVDVVNVIPSQGGGLLRGQRLIHTAETAGFPVLLGSTIEMGPGTAAFVHLAVASKNVTVPSDLVAPGLLIDDICKEPFRFVDGALQPFEKPGLGVELDEEKMEKWKVEETTN